MRNVVEHPGGSSGHLHIHNFCIIYINSKPLLVEPGVKYFINGSLKECRKFKDKHITFWFNLGMMGLFIVFFGGILLYRYKGKLTPSEI